MKCLHVSLMLMLMLTTLVSSAADGEKYISKEGKFAIAFPKDSKVKTDTKKTDSEESPSTW